RQRRAGRRTWRWSMAAGQLRASRRTRPNAGHWAADQVDAAGVTAQVLRWHRDLVRQMLCGWIHHVSKLGRSDGAVHEPTVDFERPRRTRNSSPLPSRNRWSAIRQEKNSSGGTLGSETTRYLAVRR